jgi:carbonic anhydrase/acetyltransferase-like protein (isoleucine patch superfamily)
MELPPNIRSNPFGDRPVVHPSSYIDPSAQLIGNVHIDQDVFVGPLAVLRADEPGPDGRVKPVMIQAGVSIQDLVVIHSRGGTSVLIGEETSVAHSVVIHGPCDIGRGCFLALRTCLYSATLEDGVWLGIGSIVMRTTVPSHTMVPAGAVVSSDADVSRFRVTNYKEQNYQHEVWSVSSLLRDEYLRSWKHGT